MNVSQSIMAALATLSACSAEPASTGNAGIPAERAPAAALAAPLDLTGRWRILSVDGRQPATGASVSRAAEITFTQQSMGATAGCNSFGGLGLLADEHFAVHSWQSTLIGCHNEVGAQEQTIAKLFFARPRLVPIGPDRLRFEGGGHAMEVERAGAANGPGVPLGSQELAGTSWRIILMNGEQASANPAVRVLRFDRDTWQGTASCATLQGTWRRDGDRLMVGPDISTTEQKCPEPLARIDHSFAELMRANPRYVVGPNGELLVAGGGHALTASRLQ